MSNYAKNITAEDLEDMRDIEARKNRPTETLKEFLAGLKADELI